MLILAIDTSCDETSAAVTNGTRILSNVVWSQASLHAKWGGVLPSLAQREHEKRIDWVIGKALHKAFPGLQSTDYGLQNNIDAIAVTVGPGLAIALGVGINKAKELAKKYNKPIIPVNHVEAHLLSALAESKSTANGLQTTAKQKNRSSSQSTVVGSQFPAIGIVASGGTSQVILIKNIGDYEILATTMDDALGEALDKGARALGLGYPGGAVLEKIARNGMFNPTLFPIPMIGRENQMRFSYSGLKTALVRKITHLEESGQLNKFVIQDISASYQNTAFEHFIRITQRAIKLKAESIKLKAIFVGGGVGANVLFRKKIRNLARDNNLKVFFPYTKKLYTDNAGMIGITAYLKMLNSKKANDKLKEIDRKPELQIGEI